MNLSETGYSQATISELKTVIDEAGHILIIQAENPDGDSLASSLALEHILSEFGKTVSMYCPVSMPRHLRHLPGWDRVVNELPRQFDLSIVVDTSSQMLMPRVFSESQLPILRSRPMITIDHHAVECDMPFRTIDLLDKAAVATGEVVHLLAKTCNWPINQPASAMIAASIMYDSLGLSTQSTTARSIRIVAEAVENGAKLYELDEARRELSKRDPDLTHFKGRLLQRVVFSLDNQLATVDISWEEIETYSDRYNPSVLVLDDMRMTNGVRVAIAYKSYPDGKVTAKIRTNSSAPIANIIAEHFGSGGHAFAAGFKLKGKGLDDIKQETIQVIENLLSEQDRETV